MTVSGTATFSSKTVANGKTVTATGISITGTDAANYTQNTTATTTANITARSLTVTITATDKTYDRTTTVSVTYADNRVSGDTLTVSGTPVFADRNVGVGKTVTATGISITGTDAANYTQNTTATTTASISARSLTVTITATNRVYNALTSASVTYADNRISGDSFTVSGSASFDDKTAGNGKTVTATGITLTGTDANNYAPNTTATTTANVTRRGLTVTGTFTVANRQYDATTDATNQVTLPVLAGLSDVQGADDTTLSGVPAFTFAQATVGTGISITTSGYSLAGTDAANYLLTQPTFTANITQRPLTIGGSLVTAATKTYDRNVTSTITDAGALSLVNVPAGDANAPSRLALTGLTAQYGDRNAAAGKTVTLTSASLSGSAAANYTLSLTGAPTTTADITARALNVTVTATSRTYDGTTSVSVTHSDNRIAGDLLTVSSSPSFVDKNVGTAKTVTATGITLSGADAANYAPNSTATTTANITARSLTVTITAANKTYDGNTTANVTYADTRVGGDVLTVSGTATYASRTVGAGKTVTATGIALTGTDAANYTHNTTAITTAGITQRALDITATASDRTYDRSTTASVTLSDDRVAGNALSVSFSSAAFASGTAGENKTVTVSGITVTGTDAPNYTYPTSITTTATINRRPLSVTVTPTNKVYDGTDSASVTYSDNRLGGDLLTVSGTATFSSKTAANGKAVSSSGLSLSGPDSANYSLPSVTVSAITSANISPRVLTITGTFTVVNRQYDATTDATAQVTPPALPGLSDVQLSDDVSLSGVPSFTFAQATVGTAIGITTSGYVLSGADAGNYVLTLPTFTANITQRPLTVGGTLVTPSSRPYDRTTAATITTPGALTLVNVPAGDANDATRIALSLPTAAFADRNAGTGKTVSLVSASLSGTRASNYTLSLAGAPVATVEIAPRSLTVTITASNKTYDGNTTATVTYADDRLAGDNLTVAGTPTFSTKTVGNNKTVTATGITLTGTDAANYTPNTTATTTANITQRTLTVTITASNKTYDGNTTATVTYADDRLAGDNLTVAGTPTFSTKTVGNNKTVTATGITLTGTDAANYTPNTTATTTANITQRTLTVVAVAANKTYDATNTASVTYTDNRLSGDQFTITSTAVFDDAELGRNKPVSISGITLTGPDAGNYTPNPTAASTGDITVREISAHIPGVENDAPLSDSTPSVLIGDLVPSVDTTVTFTRPGHANVVCAMVPQSVTETCTSPALTDGTWNYRARQLIAGLMVAASEQFVVTIDTTAPSATRPAVFTVASDTGPSTTDGVTSDNTPTVSIADANPAYRVVVSATSNGQTLQCSFVATASERTCVMPTLSDGAWSVSAVITDRAGNASAPTPVMTAVIDTVAPAAGAAPFNAEDNGASTSLDATPRISVTGVAVGDIATVDGTGPRAEKSTCYFVSAPTVASCEMATMTSGAWTLTSTVSDLAGNMSPVSPPTQIIISAGRAPVTVARSAVVPTPTTNRLENVVSVRFGTTAALAGVQSVSFIVFDGKGKVVRRATVAVGPTDTGARIVVPSSIKGARVRVVTTNQCGVSDGAPTSFNVRPGRTSVSIERKTNIPVLAGQLVLPEINFAPSEITLDAGDRAKLDKVAREMRGKCGTLLVSGFSRHNNTDTRRYLQNLADFRAKAVADYLSGKGLLMWISYQGFVVRAPASDTGNHRRVSVYWTPS